MKPLVIIATLLLMTGCVTTQPWERGNLAREEMLPIPDPMQAALEDHTYFSKEASSGGRGFGGGGCGCN